MPSNPRLVEGEIVTEDELRRQLRAASVLLADTGAGGNVCERFQRLRRARGWVEGVAAALDRLLREVEREVAAHDTVDEPLTRRIAPSRIEPPR